MEIVIRNTYNAPRCRCGFIGAPLMPKRFGDLLFLAAA
jgi:hypothetical protein